MSAPRAVLDAIERVSGTVPCLQCWSTVEIAYDATADRVVIRHVIRHSFGADAIAVGELVTEELARFVAMSDYEPAPLHTVVTP